MRIVFALKVLPLFGREVGKHVRNMEHHIVMYQGLVENRRTEERDDHPEEHREQKKNIPTPVCIEDLFKPRFFKAGAPKSDVRRVLLYGNPGSGKTCIGKVIAHKWALGEMLQEFKVIYVVPVDDLNFIEVRASRWKSIEEVVVQMCFKPKGSDIEYESSKTQVTDDLNVPSTLLIFDGLDEAGDYAKKLLSVVEERSCKLLILARPYNLRQMQEKVDIHFECLGFDDGQLKNFISKELDEVEASRLTESLHKNREMWEIVHIPVAAHILCSMSKQNGTVIESLREKANMFRIYDHMADFIWKRFRQKLQKTNLDEVIFFQDLEMAAFEALRNGQVIINEELVESCTTRKNHSKIMKESGFLFRTLEGCEYQFWHKTFQEFFAGRYIARCLREGSLNKKRKVKKFIQKRKYIECALTIAFAMHAFVQMCGEDALHDMFSILDEQPIEVLGVQHLFVKMQVLEASLEEAEDQDDLEGLVSDEEAEELIERARELSIRTIDHAPFRQIVVGEFNKCSNVLKRFPEVVSDTLVEGVKESLASEGDLNNGEKAKIRDVLKLVERSPSHNDDINELRLKLTNTNKDRSCKMDGTKSIASIASEASRQVQDLLSTMEEKWGDEGSNVCQKSESIARVLDLQPHELNHLSAMMARRCIDGDFCVLHNMMETIGCIVEVMPQIASDLLPMLEVGCSDEDSDVCETAERLLNDIKPEKVIPPTVGPQSSYKGGLVLLFALKAFTMKPLKKSETVFLVHTTFSREIGKWDRKNLKQYVELLRREFDEKFPGLLDYLRTKE